MKKQKIMTQGAVAVLLLAAGSASAETSALLKVTGKLAVPTCEINAPDDGTYNLGKVSSTLISATTEVMLNEVYKPWTIVCDAETFLTMTPSDNRKATNPSSYNTTFGLGSINDTGKIGYYTIRLKKVAIDSKATGLYNTTSYNSGEYYALDYTKTSGWGNAGGTALASGKVFSADIGVAPRLTYSTMMNGPVAETTPFDGSTTLTFGYGI